MHFQTCRMSQRYAGKEGRKENRWWNGKTCLFGSLSVLPSCALSTFAYSSSSPISPSLSSSTFWLACVRRRRRRKGCETPTTATTIKPDGSRGNWKERRRGRRAGLEARRQGVGGAKAQSAFESPGGGGGGGGIGAKEWRRRRGLPPWRNGRAKGENCSHVGAREARTEGGDRRRGRERGTAHFSARARGKRREGRRRLFAKLVLCPPALPPPSNPPFFPSRSRSARIFLDLLTLHFCLTFLSFFSLRSLPRVRHAFVVVHRWCGHTGDGAAAVRRGRLPHGPQLPLALRVGGAGLWREGQQQLQQEHQGQGRAGRGRLRPGEWTGHPGVIVNRCQLNIFRLLFIAEQLRVEREPLRPDVLSDFPARLRHRLLLRQQRGGAPEGGLRLPRRAGR